MWVSCSGVWVPGLWSCPCPLGGCVVGVVVCVGLGLGGVLFGSGGVVLGWVRGGRCCGDRVVVVVLWLVFC